MRRALTIGTATLIAALALAPAGATAADSKATIDTPLFDYAISLPPFLPPFNDSTHKQIATFEAEMSRHPPPEDSECAQTLGATRFARQYDDLGSAQSNAGDYAAAIAAFEKALACTPRDASIHAELASEFLHMGHLTDARGAAERGVAIDGDNSSLDSVLMQLDFIDEHWADTVARLRAMIAVQPDDERATYFQCFLWLAQRRAGVREPELVKRTEYEEWPAAVLEALRGTETEAEVLKEIRQQSNEIRRREMLAEALFYVGQLRLANGEPDTARRYFAAAVNLKVLYFIEHHLARAEIKKMKQQTAQAD